jgi:hypothetical protein
MREKSACDRKLIDCLRGALDHHLLTYFPSEWVLLNQTAAEIGARAYYVVRHATLPQEHGAAIAILILVSLMSAEVMQIVMMTRIKVVKAVR